MARISRLCNDHRVRTSARKSVLAQLRFNSINVSAVPGTTVFSYPTKPNEAEQGRCIRMIFPYSRSMARSGISRMLAVRGMFAGFHFKVAWALGGLHLLQAVKRLSGF